MEQRICSFCGVSIEPGTGLMFIKRDGSVYYFDRRRCKQSLLEFGRLPRKFKWTKAHTKGGAKAVAAAAAARAATPKVKVKQEVKVKPTE